MVERYHRSHTFDRLLAEDIKFLQRHSGDLRFLEEGNVLTRLAVHSGAGLVRRHDHPSPATDTAIRSARGRSCLRAMTHCTSFVTAVVCRQPSLLGILAFRREPRTNSDMRNVADPFPRSLEDFQHRRLVEQGYLLVIRLMGDKAERKSL
ncbi:hypothetical protein J6590_046627 [Homalodisca vitripennis]|nr:hypothetical protein J6590_046627 [Homalodisca vitripennis]